MAKQIWFISHPSSGVETTPTFFQAIQKFQLDNDHIDLVLPHGVGGQQLELTKDYLEQAHLIIAEISLASTGSGIELGWANSAGKDIIAFHQGVTPISPAIPLVATAIHAYISEKDILTVLNTLV